MQKIELTPLIEALKVMNQAETYQAQQAALELILIGAELNPDPLILVEMASSVEMLQAALNRELLIWNEALLELKPFFTFP
jgi:hypothetical protein